jgi:hypothetical protein
LARHNHNDGDDADPGAALKRPRMTFAIDRRRFIKAGLASAAAAAAPAGMAQGPTARDLLVDRARAALERLHGQFALRDRFQIVDLIGGQIFSYLCAHGKGSDPAHSGFLQRFSNEEGSLATSRGAYITGPMYDGVHGRAMRLVGLEPDNFNADPRAIVIHSADYVSENHVATWGKCGRSEGCFVVAPHMLPQVLALLGPGRMLFADRV